MHSLNLNVRHSVFLFAPFNNVFGVLQKVKCKLGPHNLWIRIDAESIC